jgi:transcriptional regulator with XRE-family HTH domain
VADPGTSITNALAEVLRDCRLELGTTQEQLAYVAGLHPTYISMLERGKRKPTVEVLYRLADGLEVSASELLRRVESSIN